MSVNWFSPTRVGRESSDASPCQITFTNKPKGVRTNAVMTRRIVEMGAKYLLVGFDPDKKTIYIKPDTNPENTFRFVTSANSGQVCSAFLWNWAKDYNLQGQRVIGWWNEEEQAFLFDFA